MPAQNPQQTPESMINVIDITEKMERWSSPFRIKKFSVQISSYGKFKMTLDDGSITLSPLDAVKLVRYTIDTLRSFKIIIKN